VTEAILTVTDSANRKLEELKQGGRLDGSGLWVTVIEEGAEFHHRIEIVKGDPPEIEHAVVENEVIRFYVDGESIPRLRGATLDFVDDFRGAGFRFDNPNKPALLENPMAVRVQTLIEDEINPGLASHGGRVSLIDVQEGRVVLRFGGGCQGCGMADVTMKEGIEGTLKAAIPEITEVVDATDHAAGTNPYQEGRA
jgi:Fe/S biogenesis protein NfuA